MLRSQSAKIRGVRRIAPFLFVLVASCATAPPRPPAPEGSPSSAALEPHRWAEVVSRPGLSNLHRVDAGLYRGAQPDEQGMQELERLGIRTVVNLRTLHSDREKIGGLPLAYEEVPVIAWNAD